MFNIILLQEGWTIKAEQKEMEEIIRLKFKFNNKHVQDLVSRKHMTLINKGWIIQNFKNQSQRTH